MFPSVILYNQAPASRKENSTGQMIFGLMCRPAVALKCRTPASKGYQRGFFKAAIRYWEPVQPRSILSPATRENFPDRGENVDLAAWHW